MPISKINLNETQYDINDSRIKIYRTVTGTAAVTSSPYYCSRWNVTDSNVTEYIDGMVVCLKVPVDGNGTYGTGFQINSLGYKAVVYNKNSMISTRYSVGSIVWCVYNSTQTATLYLNSSSASTVTGCWQVMDYDYNSNTIGYQLRTNSSVMPAITRTRYYRLLFTSADNTKWVPANTGYDNSATSQKTVNQNAIDPFGRIVYMSGTTNVPAGSNVASTVTWDQYACTLGYSFNNTGAALTLTNPAPVYVKCTPQSNGSAIINASSPYVQSLPTASDGNIYIYLGHAYSATAVELVQNHPVFYHDGSGIRYWTGKETTGRLIVTVEKGTNWSESNPTDVVCNHTIAEIWASYNRNDEIVLQYLPTGQVIPFVMNYSGSLMFHADSYLKYMAPFFSTSTLYDNIIVLISDSAITLTPAKFEANIPSMASGDAGKFLAAKSDLTGYEWKTVSIPGLPTPTASDAGKFLSVQNDGTYYLATLANAEIIHY